MEHVTSEKTCPKTKECVRRGGARAAARANERVRRLARHTTDLRPPLLDAFPVFLAQYLLHGFRRLILPLPCPVLLAGSS